MNRIPPVLGDDLWAITAYFNPMKYARRLSNYRLFREYLAVPLVTVEWTRPGNFELGSGDADILVQYPGEDILWQKERLLNLALTKVPPACRSIVWLDCDVVFTGSWPQATLAALDKNVLVQPFENLCDLPPNASLQSLGAEVRPRRVSFAHFWASTPSARDVFRTRGSALKYGYSPGHAWAARRDFLEQHRFYDAFILGSGDKLMASAAYGRMEDAVVAFEMNRRQEEHYLAWARPFYERVGSQVGTAPGTLLHLWHGELENRKYSDRLQGFQEFDFDPFTDIAHDVNGCWRWNSPKPGLHAYVQDYFAARREDG